MRRQMRSDDAGQNIFFNSLEWISVNVYLLRGFGKSRFLFRALEPRHYNISHIPNDQIERGHIQQSQHSGSQQSKTDADGHGD